MRYLKLLAAFFMMLMFFQCEETLTSTSKTTYEVGAVSFSDAVDQNGNGYASTMKFSFDIDISSGSEDVYVVISVREHDASNNSTYTTYFTSTSFTINGDASEDAKYITLGDPDIAELPHNGYDILIQVYKADDETDVIAEASMSKFSDMGNVLMETAAEDSPVRVQFNNKVFTDISITINSTETRVIPPQDSVTFNFTNGNPGTITVYAETYGKTSQGQQLGEKVTWNANVDVSGKDFMKINLNLADVMFFMYMKNTGSQGSIDWNPIYVNYGSDVEKSENIIIPADGNTYRVGYYNYLSGSSAVLAHWSGYDDSYYISWNVTSTNSVNQAWIFSDGSTKKPIAAINSTTDLIYNIGSSIPVERNTTVKLAEDAVNLTSE